MLSPMFFLAIFERVIHADWVTLVPIIAFVCFALAFGIIIFRALRMPRKEIERLSRLPLDDADDQTRKKP